MEIASAKGNNDSSESNLMVTGMESNDSILRPSMEQTASESSSSGLVMLPLEKSESFYDEHIEV